MKPVKVTDICQAALLIAADHKPVILTRTARGIVIGFAPTIRLRRESANWRELNGINVHKFVVIRRRLMEIQDNKKTADLESLLRSAA